MKSIEYFTHGNSRYIFPHQMKLNQFPAALAEMRQIACKAMSEAKTTHAIYAVKRYSTTDEIERVDFYNPPVCLDDKDFYERTQSEARAHPDCMIYAVHALSNGGTP